MRRWITLLVLFTCLTGLSWAEGRRNAMTLPERPATLVYDDLGVLQPADLGSLQKLQAEAGRRGVDVAVVVVRDWHAWALPDKAALGTGILKSWHLRPRAIVLVVCPGLREAKIQLDDTWKGGWSDWCDYIVERRVTPNLEQGKVNEAVLGGLDSINELSKAEPGANAPDLAPGFRVEKFAAQWGKWTWFTPGWFTGLFVASLFLVLAGATFASVRVAAVVGGTWLLALDLYPPAGALLVVAWLVFAAVTKRSIVPRSTPKERPPLYL